MKKRLKILWTIVAATMFLMMPENLQAQSWSNGGVTVSLVRGSSYLKVSSRCGPAGLLGKVEKTLGFGDALDSEWNCSDYRNITKNWNFEVGFFPGSSRLWKMEICN